MPRPMHPQNFVQVLLNMPPFAVEAEDATDAPRTRHHSQPWVGFEDGVDGTVRSAIEVGGY